MQVTRKALRNFEHSAYTVQADIVSLRICAPLSPREATSAAGRQEAGVTDTEMQH